MPTRTATHCGFEVFYTEFYSIEDEKNLLKSEISQCIFKLNVFVGTCPQCREHIVATEGFNRWGYVTSPFKYIKGRRKKARLLARVEAESKLSQERVYVVWGSEKEHGRLVKRIVS